MSTPTPKYNKLAGKHVLVIGGSSGIGFAVAEASIESSARVTISSSSQSTADGARSRLATAYPAARDSIRGFPCDLGTDEVERNLEALFEQTGPVDHIVFTAGDRLAVRALDQLTLANMKEAGQVRFFAAVLAAKVGSRYLGPGPECSITLTTGSVSLKPQPDWSIVAGYASGLHGLTRNLALDLRPVRVNLVSPGAVDTALWSHLDADARAAFFRRVGDAVPTGRVGRPEDVAECYLWLMKDRNVTGVVVQSDAGGLLV